MNSIEPYAIRDDHYVGKCSVRATTGDRYRGMVERSSGMVIEGYREIDVSRIAKLGAGRVADNR